MESSTCNQEQEMLSWSRVPESQMGQLIDTLLPHSSEAPRTKASAALGACPSESSVGLIVGGVGSMMSLQPWGPVLLSLLCGLCFVYCIQVPALSLMDYRP